MKIPHLVAITLGCLAALSACTSVSLADDPLPKSTLNMAASGEPASTPPCKDCTSAAAITANVNPTPIVQPIPSSALSQSPLAIAQPERVTPPPMEPSPLHGVVPAKAKPATVKTTSKIDKSAKKTVVRPTTTLEHGLFVNVGLFAVADNANKALKKLQDAGLDATKQEMSSKKGLMTRVSVGPFSSRATAETTVKQIHGLKLDAIIVQR